MTRKLDVSSLDEKTACLGALDIILTNKIEIVEDAFRKHMNVRVEAEWSGFGKLVFGKLGGAWRLLVVREDGQDVALASCPRETRVAAFTHGVIDQLVRGAGGQLDAMIARRRTAIEMADELLAALSQ